MTYAELPKYCETHMCKRQKLEGFAQCKYGDMCNSIRNTYGFNVGLAEAKRRGMLKGASDEKRNV